jgi:hypothetical protein
VGLTVESLLYISAPFIHMLEVESDVSLFLTLNPVYELKLFVCVVGLIVDD